MRVALLAIFGGAAAAQSLVTLNLSDPSIERSANWGPGNLTDRSEHAGSWLSFAFAGTSLMIVLSTYSDYGLVSIALDGGTPTTVDTYRDAPHVAYLTALDVANLAPKNHAATLTVLGPSPDGETSDSGQAWMVVHSISFLAAAIPEPSSTISPPAHPSSPARSQSPSPSSSVPEPTSDPASSTATPTRTPTASTSSPPPTSSAPPPSTTTSPTALAPAPATPQPRKANAAIIGGAAAAGALGVLLAALLLFLLLRARRGQSEPLLLQPLPSAPARVQPEKPPPSQSTIAPMSPPTTYGRGEGVSTTSDSEAVRAELAQLRELITAMALPPKYT